MRRRDKFLTFGEPVIEQEEIDAVVETLKSRWIGTGPRVAAFEERFGAYIGAPYAVAVNSCTAALHLSMLALRIEPGSEIITTPLTFCATANAIIHAGCIPVFCDVEPATKNIDPAHIERLITPRTRAVLPVHFAGYPCDMAAIGDIAERYDLKVIEDCAHAIETTINGRHAGTFGDVGCFSFYVTKNIITGEGGMVVTPDPEIEAKIKILALHGMSKDAWQRYGDSGYQHYQVMDVGFKYNMMDLQASLGLTQLAKIDRFHKRRKRLWRRYRGELHDAACTLPDDHGAEHAYHLFTLEVEPERCGKTRDQVLNEFNEWRIGVGVHYRALHLHPYYRRTYGYKPGDFPIAESIGERTLSIPFSPALSDDDVDDVLDATRTILAVR